MEKDKIVEAEYLSKDILEEYFIRSFAPFHFLQKILLTSRVDIRDRFVSSPSCVQKALSIIAIIVTLLLYIYTGITYLDRFYEYSGLYYTALGLMAMYFLTFLINIIHVRFIKAESNPKFYIQLQKIDSLMKIDQKNKLNNFLFLNNLITTVGSVTLLVIIFIAAVYENVEIVLGLSGLLYSMITCILEWLCCADLIVYFFLRMRFINAIIKNNVEDKSDLLVTNNKSSFALVSYANMRRLALESHKFETSCTDVYLKAVFDGFSQFQDHCRLQVCGYPIKCLEKIRAGGDNIIILLQILLFFAQFFIQSLMIFEFGMMALQKNALHRVELVSLPTGLSLSMLLVFVLCIRCEVFSIEVQQTKRLCITVMSRHTEGPLRMKAKKMLNMIEHRPPTFSVYNMWYMNASTMMKMVNIVTALIVALLQFAVL